MWRAIADQGLRYRAWDNEIIVYNALSGDTHLLDLAAAQVLALLQQAPLDSPSLVQQLAGLWQAAPDEQMQHEVAEILADLAALSLIAPDPP